MSDQEGVQDVQNINRKAKETSDRLMSIIRTLSSGANVEQREKEKSKLEKEYRESDKKLDVLVKGQQSELTSIIQSFSQISSKITASQERIRAIKDNLQSCKNLLHCKRDELRKLWLEGIEHKTIVSMLDQIEDIRDVNGKLQMYIERKQYLHATDLLIKSVSLLDSDLGEVEALEDVKVELRSKKEELYEVLVEALHKQVYTKATTSLVQGFQRHGSLRASRGKTDKQNMFKMALLNATQTETESVGEEQLKQLMSVDLEQVSAPKQITEDVHADPESDPIHFMAVIMESLAILKKMPEGIDNIRGQIRPGLLGIVQRASQQVYDNAYVEGENLSQIYQPQLLLEILELVFQQFRVVARIHEIIIANISRIKNSNSSLGDFCVYNTLEVWNKMQSVLTMLLGDYLDVHNNPASQVPTAITLGDVNDIGMYFSKKRPMRCKFPLFRFTASSHAISMDSYMREQRQEFYGTAEDLGGSSIPLTEKTEFVCKPCATNITLIYNPMQKFIKEVEKAIKAAPGTSTLATFVTNFIKETYLYLVMEDIRGNISTATKGAEAIRLTIDLRTQRELGVPKPLLHSTVCVARSIQDLQALMYDLPDYADQFIQMICKILHDYKNMCNTAYRGLVMSEMEDKRIISANWAKDEDIGRFLRSLPNWKNLQSGVGEQEEMSEEDLHAMNSKESSILTSNLSSTDALIPPQEVICDVSQLKSLTNMVESLEWFSNLIIEIARGLEMQHTTSQKDPKESSVLPPVSEKTLQTLRELSQDFQDLGDLCLLVLHLEVRVHCFFHLLPLPKQSNYSGAIDDMDPDPNVIKLNKDLSNIEEHLHQSLQEHKFRYIFEGLGHLVSTILINCTQYLKRINENGIKKMCRNIFAIQQCLTNITLSRESDLDHARQYYEMLYLKPEEVLRLLVERGPQYTEPEYTALLGLAHRTERGVSHSLHKERLTKLEQILTEFQSLV